MKPRTYQVGRFVRVLAGGAGPSIFEAGDAVLILDDERHELVRVEPADLPDLAAALGVELELRDVPPTEARIRLGMAMVELVLNDTKGFHVDGLAPVDRERLLREVVCAAWTVKR